MIRLPNKNIPFLEVQDLTERDSIPNRMRVEGMRFVYVKDNQKIYYLKNGITNSDWVELGAGGSSSYLGQVQDISDLSNYGADDGFLMMVVNANTIYEFNSVGETMGYQPDGIMVVSGTVSGSTWIGISGKHAYHGNNIKRVDIAETSFDNSTNYPVDIKLRSRMAGKFKYIVQDSYNELQHILFWEFITPSKHYKDMRFNTTIEINSFINNDLISEDGGVISEPIQIYVYLRQKTVLQSLNKIVNYNGLISKLKGRRSLQNRKICTLQNASSNGFEHPLVDDFMELIYDDWMGYGVPTDAKSTIGIPTRYEKLYNLIPTKFAKGKLYTFHDEINATGKRVYDTLTHTTIRFDTLLIKNLYYYDSIVIRENTSGGFYMLGENPHMGELWDSYSAVRVYCLTDNIINPRYFYFMVKPIGVDQFIIPYVPQITEGTALKSGVIFSNKKSMLKIMTNIGSDDPSIYHNSNRLFRIKKTDLSLLANHSIRNKYAKNGDNLEFRFFVYDETTGLCSQFSEQFNINFRVSGTPMKIMPNRTIRNDK